MFKFDLDFVKDPVGCLQKEPNKTPEEWFLFCSVPVLDYQEQIPSLNIGMENINVDNDDNQQQQQQQRSCLVRFRGLIRDQLNPEQYLEKIKKSRSSSSSSELVEKDEYYCTNYNQDLSNISDKVNFDDVDNTISQRYPMIMTYVPGETNWFVNDSQTNGKKIENKEKEEEEKDKIKNIPLKKCVAKFYCHANQVAICDIIEIYGVYYPPLVSEVLPEEDDDYTATLPSIHVLYWKKLDKCHNNILFLENRNNDEKIEFKKLLKTFKEKHDVGKLRNELIQYISNYTFQDVLMSEYILYNMISRLVHRNKKFSGVLIGNLPLTISNLPRKQKHICNKIIRDLQLMYTQLLPRFIYIDIDFERFNKQRIVPVKNHDTQELMINDGEYCLQIADHTQLMINQTNLTEGNFNECGVLNLQALKTLINEQKIMYDFQFHNLMFDCDIPVVILQTDEQKNLNLGFVTHACVPFNPTTIENEHNKENNDSENQITRNISQQQKEENINDGSKSIDEKKLKLFQTYLSMVRMLIDNFSLSENVTKGIEEDFVEMRQKYKNITADVLHYRLTLLRLINATFLNDDTISLDSLQYMQNLENKRLTRIEQKTNKQIK